MNTTTKFARPLPQLAISTAKVIERLRNGNVGDVVTDDELSGLTGISDRDKLLGTINRAIGMVARDHQRTWVRLHHERRIQCASVGQLTDLANGTLRSIRRRTRRTLVKCNNADIKNASHADRTVLLTAAAQLGAIGQAAAPRPMIAASKSSDHTDLRAIVAAMAGQ